MIGHDDLDAGVARGIITDAQAISLRALAAERAKAQAATRSDEEHFRFMRGFNDFFFASGVLLLGLGMAFFTDTALIRNAGAAVVVWLLAELLIGRMRLVLPGLLLVGFFAYFVMLAVPVEWIGGDATPGQSPLDSILKALTGFGYALAGCIRGLLLAVAGLVFFVRFRFPFALLSVAGGLVVAATAAARMYLPSVDAMAILLASGVTVFLAAMAFDVTDRERTTRRSDCAFWLHLLAAPLIVHSLIRLTVGNAFQSMTGPVAAAIVGIVLALTIVAVVIDRRALLVSTLAYLGIAIAYGLKAASVDQNTIFFATLLVLGAMVLTLGVGWQPLRRGLMTIVPSRLALRLPPVVTAV